MEQSIQPRKLEKVYKMGELFAGAGGLALAASRATIVASGITHRIEHVWASDYNEDACATFTKNILKDLSTEEKKKAVICGDVRKMDIDATKPIDGFAYGFPCNDFSVVGEQKGFDGTFGPLYTYGLKVLNRHKPLFFVAENVGGLLSANKGKACQKILEDLSSAGPGYALTVHLYKAEDYGVPQTRHRIFIVGIKRSLSKIFKVPEPTTRDCRITAGAALKDIPHDAMNSERTTQSAQVVERLKRINPGENAWTADLPPELQLNVLGARLSQIYKRLDPDKPSYTITGSGGGGTHVYHWDEPRALTNRERARIQTFPDDFVFEGSKESVRKQIGMAVPPKLAETIFTAVLKTLAGVQYDSIEPSYPYDNNIEAAPDLEACVM